MTVVAPPSITVTEAIPSQDMTTAPARETVKEQKSDLAIPTAVEDPNPADAAEHGHSVRGYLEQMRPSLGHRVDGMERIGVRSMEHLRFLAHATNDRRRALLSEAGLTKVECLMLAERVSRDLPRPPTHGRAEGRTPSVLEAFLGDAYPLLSRWEEPLRSIGVEDVGHMEFLLRMDEVGRQDLLGELGMSPLEITVFVEAGTVAL